MKFDEEMDDYSEEIFGDGGGLFGPFKMEKEENIYQIIKPYLDNTYAPEIKIQHDE